MTFLKQRPWAKDSTCFTGRSAVSAADEPIGGRNRSRPARGLTLVESAVSMVIVSVLLVASVNLVGAAGKTRLRESDGARGRFLAGVLMAEILSKKYSEPTAGGATLGVDSGEVQSPARSTLDDIDDYHGLAETAILDAAGTAITGFSGFSRGVSVTWVDPADLAVIRASESGAKAVTIVVKFNGKEVARLATVRTSAWKATNAE